MGTTISAVDKALSILDLLAEQHYGLRVSDIAHRMDIPYSTAHRLVSTLEANGYVVCSPETGKYALSLKILQLYRGLSHRMNLNQISFSHLSQLMEKYGETVHLAVDSDGEVVYLDTIVSSRSLAMYTETGKRVAIHATALGKVLAAYLPETEVRAILISKGMKQFTPNTIVTPTEFMEELERVRANGYALDNEEFQLGVRCVASSLIDHSGQVVGAVSVSAPASRLAPDRVNEIAQSVVATCDAISRELGATKRAIQSHRAEASGKDAL